MVDEGTEVGGGETIARTPRQSTRTKDITGGLPRVAELFEARRPKEAAEIARIDGVVELGKINRGRRTITIRDPENDQVEDHVIPAGKRVVVFNGDFVRKGDQLTDGAVVPHEILEICGPQELQEYLVNEVQEVAAQGVEINDKHIEIIVRQMMRGTHHRAGYDTLPFRRIGRSARVPGGERQGRGRGRPARRGPADPAGHHQGEPGH